MLMFPRGRDAKKEESFNKTLIEPTEDNRADTQRSYFLEAVQTLLALTEDHVSVDVPFKFSIVYSTKISVSRLSRWY